MNAPGHTTSTTPGPVPGRVRAQQAFLYVFGAVTLAVLVGFTGWVVYAVGGVWWSRLTGG